jgi:hypothetical protein
VLRRTAGLPGGAVDEATATWVREREEKERVEGRREGGEQG